MALEWYKTTPDARVIDDLKSWRRKIGGLRSPTHDVAFGLLLLIGLRNGGALNRERKTIHEDRVQFPMTRTGRSFVFSILPVHHDILAPLKPPGRT